MGVLAGFRERNKTSSAAVAVSVKADRLSAWVHHGETCCRVGAQESLTTRLQHLNLHLGFWPAFHYNSQRNSPPGWDSKCDFWVYDLLSLYIISTAKIKLMTRSKWLFIQESLSGRAVIWMFTIDINRNIKQLTVMVKVYINSCETHRQLETRDSLISGCFKTRNIQTGLELCFNNDCFSIYTF